MADLGTKVWDELLAEFPVLWNPRELHFRDRHTTDQVMLQLLEKCNSMSKIPFTFKSLKSKVIQFHRRRKYYARKEKKAKIATSVDVSRGESSIDVSRGESSLSDQCASSDSTEPVDKIQSVRKNPTRVCNLHPTCMEISGSEDPDPDIPIQVGSKLQTLNPTQPTEPFTIVFHCCGVCGEVKGEWLKGTDKSYIVNNKTTLAMNDLRTELDFDKDTTVCQNCDKKLKEMYEFVKLVTSAQDKMNVNINSGEDQMPIDVDDDDDEHDDKKVIINSLKVSDTELVNPTVKRTCEEPPEVKKKFKVTIDLNFSNDNINDDRSTMDDIEAKYQMFKKGDGSLAKSADEVSKEVTENNEEAILKLKKIIEQDMYKGVTATEEATDADKRNDTESELTSHRKDENSEDIILDVKNEIDADNILNEVNETGEIFTDDDKINDAVTEPICDSLKSNETTSNGESVCGMPKSDLIDLIKSIVSQMLNK